MFVQPECMYESLPWMALAKTKPWNSFDQHQFLLLVIWFLNSLVRKKITARRYVNSSPHWPWDAFLKKKTSFKDDGAGTLEKILTFSHLFTTDFVGFFLGPSSKLIHKNLRKNISKVLPIGQLRASGSFQQLPSRSPCHRLGGVCRIGTKVGNVWENTLVVLVDVWKY